MVLLGLSGERFAGREIASYGTRASTTAAATREATGLIGYLIRYFFRCGGRVQFVDQLQARLAISSARSLLISAEVAEVGYDNEFRFHSYF